MNEGDLVADRYRLLRPIGRGAMGTVWAARHELLARDFALKFARLPLRAGPEARERFLREAQAIGRVRHPNVVDVSDFGEVAPGGGLFLAMELLEGESLAERLQKRGPLEPAEAVAIAAEIAHGLVAAHAAGIVHRDIKPENIFLARSARGGVVPKLLDFGISKHATDDRSSAADSASIGTPAYMSPEQALGEADLDHRTDIWSLGVVIHEMLTCEHPFVAPNYPALMTRIAGSAPSLLGPSVPEIVRAIVAHCLEKRPDDRFGDAMELATALEDALAEIGPQTGELLPIERPRTVATVRPPGAESEPSSRRHLVLLAMAVALAIAAVVVLVRLVGPGRASAPSTTASAASAAAPLVASASPPLPSASAAVSAAPSTTAPLVAPPTSAAASAASTTKRPSPAPAPSATPKPTSSGKPAVTHIDGPGF